MGARGRVVIGRTSSFPKVKDVYPLGVEDLGLVNPSFDSDRNAGHGKDHLSDLLV